MGLEVSVRNSGREAQRVENCKPFSSGLLVSSLEVATSQPYLVSGAIFQN